LKILYLSQYFFPEVGATQIRTHEMAAGLIKSGHQVTVIAEMPNHPQGIIYKEFRGKVFDRTQLGNIEVVRVWVRASPKKNFFNRLVFYLSFMLMAVVGGLFIARKKYDIMYVTSPPLTVGGTALVLSYLRKIKMVFEIRDIWPHSAIMLGEIRSKLAISLSHKLEYVCYRHARHIVVTQQEMRDHLVTKGIGAEKISIIPNGSNTALFYFQVDKRMHLRKAYHWEKKFVVIYAGIFGIAQNLKIVLDAAQIVLSQDEQVQFLLIGDGPERAVLIEDIEQLALPNIICLPAQPREQIPAFLCAADAAWVPVVNKQLIGLMPSKLFDALACERPVILGAVGPACQLLEAHAAGIVIPPEDPEALAAAILSLKAKPELCQSMGKAGRRLVQDRYSREKQAKQLNRLLKSLINNASTAASV
jgi:colanic acid biosynthesis glycosyl transferase WcaI